jgi:hypothetical protein
MMLNPQLLLQAMVDGLKRRFPPSDTSNQTASISTTSRHAVGTGTP